MSSIYRYKLSKTVLDLIIEFSQKHKYIDRTEYKEEWKKFLETNKSAIETEKRRLSELGYKGNIEDKMYKSGRYYFREKTYEKTEPKKRVQYKKMDPMVLSNINVHVKLMIKEHMKPSEAYNKFINDFNIDEKDKKIKKSYKNQFYNMKKDDVNI